MRKKSKNTVENRGILRFWFSGKNRGIGFGSVPVTAFYSWGLSPLFCNQMCNIGGLPVGKLLRHLNLYWRRQESGSGQWGLFIENIRLRLSVDHTVHTVKWVYDYRLYSEILFHKIHRPILSQLSEYCVLTVADFQKSRLSVIQARDCGPGSGGTPSSRHAIEGAGPSKYFTGELF